MAGAKALVAAAQMLVLALPLAGQLIERRGGVVVLSDGQVFTGSIYYPQGFDMIFLRTDDGRIALSAAKIQLFRYYDSSAQINRKFISIKKDESDSRIYEVVAGGEVAVLRVLKRHAGAVHPDEIDSYDYFTYTKGMLEPIAHFRNKVFPKILEDQPIEIQAYVHREGLDPCEMKSALLIIAEFNRIKQGDLHARAD